MAGYYRDLSGWVHLQGFVEHCGVVTSPPFILPPGFRPDQSGDRFVILKTNDDTSAGLSIDTAGDVSVSSSAGGDQFSLSGVSFRCGPSGKNGCP